MSELNPYQSPKSINQHDLEASGIRSTLMSIRRWTIFLGLCWTVYMLFFGAVTLIDVMRAGGVNSSYQFGRVFGVVIVLGLMMIPTIHMFRYVSWAGTFNEDRRIETLETALRSQLSI